MGVGSKEGGGGLKENEEAEEEREEEGSLCKRTVTTFRHALSHHFSRDQAPESLG